ncbi:MAG: AbrB/MazE/SpoVT family DNA-binding domain-containing protein [Candidatus Bathyarchaeia archaeon]|nr:AbrB/MazE/SpoVT family DNA-binding domain-containing protein [Candidatus Bathyarchaeia archaeon]
MELKIGNKGRITLPIKLRMLLGIKEGDSLTIEITSRGILLKPKGPSAKDIWGAAKLDKVEIEEIEEALGKES